MALNYPEIALIVGLNAAILAGTLLMFVKLGAPKLLSRAEVWMGGAIGRFMQNLSKQAVEEEGDHHSGTSSPGALELGGPKIMGMGIPEIMELIKLAQSMGFLKGGGGGGTNPFLKG